MNGDTLYAWQERTREGWGIIAAALPPNHLAPLAPLGPLLPLVFRSKDAAQQFEPIAQSHVKATGNEIRLGVFTLADSKDTLAHIDE